jgi:hypothetical protein
VGSACGGGGRGRAEGGVRVGGRVRKVCTTC